MTHLVTNAIVFALSANRNLALMPTHDELLSAWRKAIERVTAAQVARDKANPGTPERQAADAEHEAALAEYRSIAAQFR